MSKNSYLALISCLIGIILFYIALFIYTFINFDNEFDHNGIWLYDNMHLNSTFHGNLFMQKILNELDKFLLQL